MAYKEKHLPLPPLEELKEFLDYNPDTGIIIWKKSPSNRVKVGGEAGYITYHGYKAIKFKNQQYRFHRIAYYMHHGIDPLGKMVDHENLNKQDNWIKNLRLATRPENGWNRKLNTNNTSGVMGVCWLEKRKRWVAQIKVNGKTMWRSFVNKEDAIQARKEAEKKYFGKFRRSD